MSRGLVLLLGSITTVSMCWSGLAEPVAPPASAATVWQVGPVKQNLGALGELQVPQGYKFMPPGEARAFLKSKNQPEPKNLLGLLALSSEETWWAVLRFDDQGYLQHPKTEGQNFDEALKTLPTVNTSQNWKWESKPAYDAPAHTLEWAVREANPQTTNGASPVVVQTLRLLCRQGSVDATVVKPYRGFPDPAPLSLLVKYIALKDGERYGDYQNGDKVCNAGLADLILADVATAKPTLTSGADSEAVASLSAPSKAKVLWLGGGGAACAIALGGIGFYVRGSRRKPRRNRKPESAVQAALPPVNGNGVAKPAAATLPAGPQSGVVVHANGERPVLKAPPATRPLAAKFAPKTELLRKPLNGKNHGPRRKVFDYNRYFADLMGAVSGSGTQVELPPTNGASLESSRFAMASSGTAAATSASAVHQQAELLASQRELIAEQKRLIQEQNKLIEEKTRLIAEKNELLKLQTQLMDDKLI